MAYRDPATGKFARAPEPEHHSFADNRFKGHDNLVLALLIGGFVLLAMLAAIATIEKLS